MRFQANVHVILAPSTEVPYNAASLSTLYHHVDPKHSVIARFLCTLRGIKVWFTSSPETCQSTYFFNWVSLNVSHIPELIQIIHAAMLRLTICRKYAFCILTLKVPNFLYSSLPFLHDVWGPGAIPWNNWFVKNVFHDGRLLYYRPDLTFANG